MYHLWLLVGVSVFVGLMRFTLTDVNAASYFVQYVSYYENWVLIVCLGYWLWTNFRGVFLENGRVVKLLRENWVGLALAIVIPLMWQASNTRMLKTLQDELVLSATAKSYAMEREAKHPNSTVQVGGELVVSTHLVGKRPTMFPFMVSVAHNFTGYRIENVYLVNFGLSVTLFVMMYGFGVSNFGRLSAVSLQVLVGSVPLFAQQTTSGSYEILNLCGLVGMWLCGQHYLKRKSPESLALLVVMALHFARCRYESILGLAVVALLWGFVALKERKLNLNYFVCFSPLLLLAPLFSNAVLMDHIDLMEKPVEAPVFSFAYFPENFSNALYYLFSGGFSSAPAISAMGIVGLLMVLLNLRNALKSLNSNLGVSYVLIGFVIGLTGFYLTCFWGNWADGVATRFSMPFLLLCCIGTVMAFSVFGKKASNVLVAIAVAHLLIFYKPYANTNYDDGGSYPRLENHWWMAFMENNAKRDALYISHEILGSYLLERPGMNLKMASIYPEAVDYAMRVNYYKEVFMMVRYYNTPDSEIKNERQRKLETLYELELIDTLGIRTDTYSVIYRVKGVRPEQLAKKRLAVPEESGTVPDGMLKFSYPGLPGFYPAKSVNVEAEDQ